MLMIASFSCGVLAMFLSFLAGVSFIIALPGLVVGVFFAYRYAKLNRVKDREEEEHKRSRKRRNR
jgi:membrane associated rhomboid family serine protease